MYFSLLLTVVSLASLVLSSNPFLQCKTSDLTCLQKSINTAIPLLSAGNPKLGIESFDPQFIIQVDGDLPNLNYKLYNSTLSGYKDCLASNLKIDEAFTTMHIDFNCPNFTMEGKYEIKGRLITLPIEGNGDYRFISGKYLLKFDLEIIKIQGVDGKSHFFIKDFKVKSIPIDPVQYDFKNLFNGQKDLADALHKYTLEHGIEIAKEVHEPGWLTSLKQVIENVNQHLENIAIDDILLN